MPHASDSSEQLLAESTIIAAVAEHVGVALAVEQISVDAAIR